MPDKKISDLLAASALDGTEIFPLVQGAATKKASAKEVAKLGYQDIITETGTAKTLAISDIGAWIRFTATGGVTCTVPSNATVPFPIGTTLNGIQAGSGQVTFVASGGVTVNKPADYNAKTRLQSAPWCLVKVAADVWDLLGDLELIVL